MSETPADRARRRQRDAERAGLIIRCACRERAAGPSTCRVEHGVWLVSRARLRPARPNG